MKVQAIKREGSFVILRQNIIECCMDFNAFRDDREKIRTADCLQLYWNSREKKLWEEENK